MRMNILFVRMFAKRAMINLLIVNIAGQLKTSTITTIEL